MKSNGMKFKALAMAIVLSTSIGMSTVCAAIPTSYTTSFIKGDVNRDEVITLDDTELIKQHIMEEVVLDEEQLFLADVDSDGDVDSVDYVKLKNAMNGNSYRFLKGDVNRDGKITGDDVTLLSKSLTMPELFDEEQKHLGDLNDDSKINITDVAFLNAIVKGARLRYLKGDLTRDGRIELADVTQLIKFYLNTETPDDEQLHLGDMNDDGIINLSDQIALMKIYLGSELRYTRGDVNRDGMVTMDDWTLLGDYVAGTASLDSEQMHLANVYEDYEYKNGATEDDEPSQDRVPIVNGKDYNMLYEILTGKTLRYDLGDVNRDGNMDNEDLNMVQAHINGTSSLDDEQIHLADVSQDGNITTKDLNMIYAIIKENTFEKADINKDKVIDQKDLAALNAYLENGAELPDESLADLNCDGVVDTTDKELLEAKLNNPNYLLGDINGDKKVNADDAANAIEIFKTNSATIEKLAVGDMNYDGTINAEDAALIIEYFKTHN